MPSPRAKVALACAVALAALLAVLWMAAFRLGWSTQADATLFNGFLSLRPNLRLRSAANTFSNLFDARPYASMCVAPIGIALARRRVTVAAAIVVILACANATTYALKHLLLAARPAGLLINRWWLPPGTWPSGHATAVMALALCMTLASPAVLRPYAAAAGVAVTSVACCAMLALGWHYPSDIIAGLLVATIWALLGVVVLPSLAASRRVTHKQPAGAARTASMIAPGAATAGGVALAAALLSRAGFGTIEAGVRSDHELLLGAVVITATVLALTASVALRLDRS